MIIFYVYNTSKLIINTCIKSKKYIAVVILRPKDGLKNFVFIDQISISFVNHKIIGNKRIT